MRSMLSVIGIGLARSMLTVCSFFLLIMGVAIESKINAPAEGAPLGKYGTSGLLSGEQCFWLFVFGGFALGASERFAYNIINTRPANPLIVSLTRKINFLGFALMVAQISAVSINLCSWVFIVSFISQNEKVTSETSQRAIAKAMIVANTASVFATSICTGLCFFFCPVRFIEERSNTVAAAETAGLIQSVP